MASRFPSVAGPVSAPTSSAARDRGLGRLGAHVRLMRPYSLLWFVAIPVATHAALLAGPSVNWADVVMLVLACAAGDAAFTTLNDIKDQATDARSGEAQRNQRPLVVGATTERAAWLQVVALACLSVSLSFSISFRVGALMVLGAAFGASYSAGPFHFMSRPLVSQAFWVVLWPAMLVVVYWTVGGSIGVGLAYAASNVAFMGVGETLAKDLRDLENDAATGKRTTPVALGHRVASGVSVWAFGVGAAGYGATAAVAGASVGTMIGLVVVLGLWIGRASILVGGMLREYNQAAARDLHVGSVRVFLTVNLLLIAGLTS